MLCYFISNLKNNFSLLLLCLIPTPCKPWFYKHLKLIIFPMPHYIKPKEAHDAYLHPRKKKNSCCMVVQNFFAPNFFEKALIAHLFILLCFISSMVDRDMQALLSCYCLTGVCARTCVIVSSLYMFCATLAIISNKIYIWFFFPCNSIASASPHRVGQVGEQALDQI